MDIPTKKQWAKGKQYFPPKLVCYGSVAQLTTTGSGTMDEATSGGIPMCVANATKMNCGI